MAASSLSVTVATLWWGLGTAGLRPACQSRAHSCGRTGPMDSRQDYFYKTSKHRVQGIAGPSSVLRINAGFWSLIQRILDIGTVLSQRSMISNQSNPAVWRFWDAPVYPQHACITHNPMLSFEKHQWAPLKVLCAKNSVLSLRILHIVTVLQGHLLAETFRQCFPDFKYWRQSGSLFLSLGLKQNGCPKCNLLSLFLGELEPGTHLQPSELWKWITVEEPCQGGHQSTSATRDQTGGGPASGVRHLPGLMAQISDSKKPRGAKRVGTSFACPGCNRNTSLAKWSDHY